MRLVEISGHHERSNRNNAKIKSCIQMINVLQFIDSFIQGGTERQTVQLTRLLHESGRYRVHLACSNPDGPLRADAERLGLVEIPSFPLTSFYDRNFVVQLRRLARYLRECQIDIIHTHDFYTNVFGMAGASFAGVPVRVASKRETSGMRTAAQRLVEHAAFSLAHGVVVNSEAVRRQLVAEGIQNRKITTVYNGLEIGRVRSSDGADREETLASFGLPADQPLRFITIVANLRHEIKDHRTFLRAARLVRQDVPDARFVIAGEGPLEQPMRVLAAELGIGPDVFFTGACERVAELLFISDVCALSSIAEGFSNSILEYMAAARPVVATNVGGTREAVIDGQTGYIVAAGDEHAMAGRIIELLQSPEQARAMGKRGRDLVAQKFSCEARLERTEELYERLLAGRRIPMRRGMRAVVQEDT
jgi:glycosyltransferase involved in cell wall biosynthesis